MKYGAALAVLIPKEVNAYTLGLMEGRWLVSDYLAGN
jgi:hypothetical protein